MYSLKNFLQPNIFMDFDALEKLSSTLNDQGYVEYIWHKFFSNSQEEFKGLENYCTWQYPKCWLARYWLYYVCHKFAIQGYRILDLGANFNFYGVWALLNGAKHVFAIEPDNIRFNLGKEYVRVRNVEKQFILQCQTINEFMQSHTCQTYDVVFLQDVLYYLNNHIEVLQFIKTKIKPKFLFLESTIIDDHTDNGHMNVWYPSTDTKHIQSILIDDKTPMAFMPSRIALRKTIDFTGWKVLSYYNYQDFLGNGESKPRSNGKKDFYLLCNEQ